MMQLFSIAAVYILAFIGLLAVVAIIVGLYVAYHFEININLRSSKTEDTKKDN